MTETTVQRPKQQGAGEQPNGTSPKAGRAATPQEFYRRITQRPEIRDLLRRLATR